MLDFILHVPLFVWPLFVILLIGGLKATKTSEVPLLALLLVPIGVFVWSALSFFSAFGSNFSALAFWIFCLSAGCSAGVWNIQRLKPRCNRKTMQLEMPGSLVPLLLSMSIFSAKFLEGVLKALQPSSEGLVFLELFSGFIVGALIGRALGCYLAFRSAAELTGEM